jgi:carbon starvation protein
MNAVVALLIGVAAIAVGYGVYARSINRSVIQPDAKRATPAKMFMDGVDFTPANRNVLFGYQFKSIAALGPILGPIIAVQWGWLPALLWIVLGTFFIGWVQDFASIIMGVREEGQSFGALSYRLVSPRSRMILIIFIYFYLWLIMGSFGVQVGFNLFTNPAVPLGVLIVILAGVLAGQMTYKWKQDIILTSVVTVVVALVGIWIGTMGWAQSIFTWLYGTVGGAASPVLFLTVTQARFFGSLFVVIICYLGAVLPIWRWAQPINYVSFWIVFLGIVGGVVGLLIWRPGIGDFPSTACSMCPARPLADAVRHHRLEPSGWHSLIFFGHGAPTREGDRRALGGGSMFLECSSPSSPSDATVAFGSYRGYVGRRRRRGQVFSVGLAPS